MLRHYSAVDFVSVLPFDVIGLGNANQSVGKLKVLRIVRLLRLAKLLRVMRAGRTWRRLESSFSVDYGLLTVSSFVLTTMFLSHWCACARR